MLDPRRVSVLGEERAVVVGAGSLGTVYGAALARAGRGRAASRAGGARPRNPGSAAASSWTRSASGGTCRCAPSGGPSGSSRPRSSILLTKTPDTTSALAGLAQVRDAVRIAASFQNGVDKDDDLAAVERPGGGRRRRRDGRRDPARARPRAHTMNGPSFLGELDGMESERVDAARRAARGGGLPAVVTTAMRSVEWSKLVHGSPTTALPALTGLYLHEICITPELRARSTSTSCARASPLPRRPACELEDWASAVPRAARSRLRRTDEALEVALAHGAGSPRRG